MKGALFDEPTIKFEGSTDGSQLDIDLEMYGGMNEICAYTSTVIYC
jgi:hypothetical protein